MKKALWGMGIMIATLIITVSITPASGSKEGWPKVLSYSSGPAGGTWYGQDVPIGNLVSKTIGIPVDVAACPAGPHNNVRLARGETQLIHQSSGSTANMYLLRGPFKKMKRITSIRSLWRCDQNAFNIVARAGAKIKNGYDLRGKRLMGDYKPAPPFGTCVEANLATWGLTKKDVKWLGFSSGGEVRTALIEGTTDAGVWSMTTKPSGFWLNLLSSTDIVYIGANEKEVEKVSKDPKYTGFVCRSFKAGSYKDMNKENYSFGTLTAMYTNYELPEDLVYEITKAVWDNIDSLKKDHPGTFIDYDLAKAPFIADWMPPYHKGAVKYYKEKGVWTEKCEAHQKKILKLYGMKN